MPEYYLIHALSFQDLVNYGLDEWIYLFKNSKVEDGFTAKRIDKAKEKLAVAKLPKRKRQEYEQYLKSLHSEASWNETQRIKAEIQEKLIKEAKKEAKAEAKEEAKAEAALEKEQMILKMHLNGLSISDITAFTGKSEAEILQIIAKYKK